MNWQSVITSHMGIAILALADELPDWRARLRIVLRVLLAFLDTCPADGSFEEGLAYWHYGIGELCWFALALQTFTGGKLDLFQHPYLKATQQFPLYLSAPDGCFDFEDCPNFAPRDWLSALLARQYRNPLLQGVIRPYDEQAAPHRKIDAPARGMRHLLSRDCSLPATPLEGLPGSRYFAGNDTVIMRSDWGPRGTFLALHGGSNIVPHAHLDAGSFIIGHGGKRLIPDSGFWPYARGFFDRAEKRWDFDGTSTLGHSLVLVDGQGQGREPGCRARVESVDLAGAVQWAVCDVTDAYQGRLQRFVRYLLFIQPSTVLIVDDLVASRPRWMKWLLQYRASARLCPPSIQIRNGDAFATVSFPFLQSGSAYVFSNEQRHSHYQPSAPDAEPSPPVRFVSLSPSDPLPSWQVVAALRLSENKAEAPVIVPVHLGVQGLALKANSRPGESFEVGLNFEERTVSVRRECPCPG